MWFVDEICFFVSIIDISIVDVYCGCCGFFIDIFEVVVLNCLVECYWNCSFIGDCWGYFVVWGYLLVIVEF